ncbi:hypothetical protein BS47DRAFT_1357996 [Hydnum rufescens UP504]|uniref:Uncharacterized protein n=1 Tax=Hydnum rufescens UP504 TaxID=1448309 RepID=A0A9P6B9B5_9AGAM|nr:hypothetical protein BS47DRAFT_1357996 [Hydnum rufescens UP504]
MIGQCRPNEWGLSERKAITPSWGHGNVEEQNYYYYYDALWRPASVDPPFSRVDEVIAKILNEFRVGQHGTWTGVGVRERGIELFLIAREGEAGVAAIAASLRQARERVWFKEKLGNLRPTGARRKPEEIQEKESSEKLRK